MASQPQPVGSGSLPLAQNAWHCTSYYTISYRVVSSKTTVRLQALPPTFNLLLGERERAHLVVQPARKFYIYTCDRVILTVISISPSRVTSRACAQSLGSFLFCAASTTVHNMDSEDSRSACNYDKQVSSRPSKGRSA